MAEIRISLASRDDDTTMEDLSHVARAEQA
jgi:hypothetical protein